MAWAARTAISAVKICYQVESMLARMARIAKAKISIVNVLAGMARRFMRMVWTARTALAPLVIYLRSLESVTRRLEC